MADVKIRIAEGRNRDGSFDSYSLRCRIDGKQATINYLTDIVEMASDVLFKVYFLGVENPEYSIKLWEGTHPLKDCPENCSHYRYTQKPQNELKGGLERYLNDPELNAAAKARAERNAANLKATYIHDGTAG